MWLPFFVQKLPFDPLEWLASNFSQQYHPWIKHLGREKNRGDRQLKKLLIVKQFSLPAPYKTYTKQFGEYSLSGCKGLIKSHKETIP